TLSVPNLGSYTGSFSVEPPADSDVDHPQLSVTATVVDPADANLTTTGNGTLDIHVDANADAGPGAVGGVDDGDADVLSISIDAVADSNDADGVVQGGGSLPAGVTFDLAVDGSSVTFSMPTNSAVGSDLTVVLDVTNVDAENGTPAFTASATAAETTTGDEECDPSDNTATVTDEAPVTVANVSPPTVLLALPDGVDCIEEDSVLTDAANLVTLSVTADGDDELTEIVISGFESGWDYDLSGLEVLGATLTDDDFSDGSITLSVPNLGSYTGSFSVEPPADSDVDHPQLSV
ncbi:unnamed protein product, partial [Ectocarpus fasciculatus]